MSVTRLAPTPSGFLHAGNLHNFRVTQTLAEERGLTLALRIDDSDAARYRRVYVDDIFRVLRDLGVTWTVGPRDSDDFEANWSQRLKTEYYRAELERLQDSSLTVYACRCSRREMIRTPTGGCPGACMSKSLPLIAGETALRVHVPKDTRIVVNDTEVDLATSMGDFVVWRRDDLPAYQLVSVVEDRDLGTTHIVRGADLITSTAAQILLAPPLDAASVASATYLHHSLITDAQGTKLSKSRDTRLIDAE